MTELTVNISEMKSHFDEYMQRIKSGEVIIITKYGKPIAQFTPFSMMEKKQKHLAASKRPEQASSTSSLESNSDA